MAEKYPTSLEVGSPYLVCLAEGLSNLPGVGDDPDGVAADDDNHDVDTDAGELNLAFPQILLQFYKGIQLSLGVALN